MRMSWSRRFPVALALLSAALWLTTSVASAQSLGLPNTPQLPASPPKVNDTVHQATQQVQAVAHQATQPVQAVAQSAKQTVATVNQATQPVKKAAQQAAAAVTQTAR